MRNTPRPLTTDEQDLVTRYIPLARGLTRSFTRRWPEHADEFESDAILALMYAAIRFDPSRGVSFAHFARTRILGALKDKHRVKLGTGQNSDHIQNVEYIGVMVPVENRVEEREIVEKLLRVLPRIHARIVRWVDRDGLSQVEVGKLLASKRCHYKRLSATTISVYRSKGHALMRRAARLFDDPEFRRKVFGELSPRQAMAYQLTHIEGLRVKDAARRMGVRAPSLIELRDKATVKVNAILEALDA